MARTDTAPTEAPASPTPVPETPAEPASRPSPVLAWPAEWPVPDFPEPEHRRRRTRGLPMGPVLAGASNATALTTTAAYSAGGPVAAAATGAAVAVGATAAALRRRAAVRRSVAARTSRATGLGSGSAGRSGGGSGLSRAGRSGAGSGGATRSGSGSLWRSSGSSSGAPGSGSGRKGSGASSGRSGSQAGRHGGGGLRHSRALDKALRKQQKRADKTAAKAVKDLASKSRHAGKSNALKAAAGRAARAAWNATRPPAARAAKATGRGLRQAGGALWDGLCSTAAAGWAWLRRDRHAALDRLKAVWKRRRKTRKDNEQQPDTETTPTVADTVRRPTTPTPTTTSGGTRMSGGGHHFVAPAMELARAAANYQPQGMLQVGADFAGLEEALRLHAEAMKITVENADAHQPLATQIVELMRQIHGLQLKAADLAAELTPAFRQLHDVDIARLENPRKGVQGERMWDISANL